MNNTFSIVCVSIFQCSFGGVICFPFSVFRFPFSVFRFPFSVFRFPFSVFRFPFSVFRTSILFLACIIGTAQLYAQNNLCIQEGCGSGCGSPLANIVKDTIILAEFPNCPIIVTIRKVLCQIAGGEAEVICGLIWQPTDDTACSALKDSLLLGPMGNYNVELVDSLNAKLYMAYLLKDFMRDILHVLPHGPDSLRLHCPGGKKTYITEMFGCSSIIRVYGTFIAHDGNIMDAIGFTTLRCAGTACCIKTTNICWDKHLNKMVVQTTTTPDPLSHCIADNNYAYYPILPSGWNYDYASLTFCRNRCTTLPDY